MTMRSCDRESCDRERNHVNRICLSIVSVFEVDFQVLIARKETGGATISCFLDPRGLNG